MKRFVDILCWVVGLIAIVVAVWQLFLFLSFKDARGMPDMMAGTSHLWMAIVAAALAIACVVFFFIRNPRREEEIHITDQ